MRDAQLHDDLTALAGIIKDLSDRVSKNDDRSAVSSIHVNAGGAATWVTAWVCSICAAFMAGAMLIGGFWVSRELTRNEGERAELRRADNDMRDYISAIYQAAPELQKRIEKEK